jgi:hypothetical protein
MCSLIAFIENRVCYTEVLIVKLFFLWERSMRFLGASFFMRFAGPFL